MGDPWVIRGFPFKPQAWLVHTMPMECAKKYQYQTYVGHPNFCPRTPYGQPMGCTRTPMGNPCALHGLSVGRPRVAHEVSGWNPGASRGSHVGCPWGVHGSLMGVRGKFMGFPGSNHGVSIKCPWGEHMVSVGCCGDSVGCPQGSRGVPFKTRCMDRPWNAHQIHEASPVPNLCRTPELLPTDTPWAPHGHPSDTPWAAQGHPTDTPGRPIDTHGRAIRMSSVGTPRALHGLATDNFLTTPERPMGHPCAPYGVFIGRPWITREVSAGCP